MSDIKIKIYVPDGTIYADTFPAIARYYKSDKKVDGGYIVGVSLNHIFDHDDDDDRDHEELQDTLLFIQEAINLMYWSNGRRKYVADVLDLPAGRYTVSILNTVLDYLSIPAVADDILHITDSETFEHEQREAQRKKEAIPSAPVSKSSGKAGSRAGKKVVQQYEDSLTPEQYHQRKEVVKKQKYKNRWL